MLLVTYLNGNTTSKNANPLLGSITLLLRFTAFLNAIPRFLFAGNENMQCG